MTQDLVVDWLDCYLVPPIQRKWLEEYRESLKAHIAAVREAGRQLGVPEDQLAIHDASKWDREEFSYYARQFHGDKADPDGFAHAWLHHIHVNPHHWQHWIFPDAFTPKNSTVECGVVKMPPLDALEMVADWMGASKVYTGSSDMTDWLLQNVPRIILHSRTATFVTEVLKSIGYAETISQVSFRIGG